MKTVIIEEDKYKVDIDSHNHTLYKYDKGGYEIRVPKSKEKSIKKPSWNLMGYYPNMKQCMSAAIHDALLEGTTTITMGEYLTEIKDLAEKLGGRANL